MLMVNHLTGFGGYQDASSSWAGAITNLGFGHSASGSVAVTVGAACAIGDTVFVIANSDGTNVPGVTDSGSNTWTQIGSTLNLNGSSANGNATLWYSVLTTGLTSGVSTITNTTSGAGSTQLNCSKITGLSAAPLDTAVTATATGTGASPTVTSGTPAQSGECFVAGVSYRTSATFTQDTGNGWAAPPNLGPTGTSGPTISIGGGSQLNSGSGTKTFAPTIGAVTYAIYVVGFKPA